MFANDISRKLIVKLKPIVFPTISAVTSQQRGRLIIIAIADHYLQLTL